MARSAANGPTGAGRRFPRPRARETAGQRRSRRSPRRSVTLWAMQRARSDHHSQWFVAPAVVAAAIYSWIAAGFRPFTVAEEIMVAIPALVVFVAAWRPSRPPAAVPVVAGVGRVLARPGRTRGGVGAPRLLLDPTPRSSDPERDRRRDHERARRPRADVPAVARTGLGARPEPAGVAVMTSRTLTFVGYGAILALIVALAIVAKHRANWMTLPDALNALTRESGGEDPGGRRLGVARLAPLRPRQRRLQVARPLGKNDSTRASGVPIAARWEARPSHRSSWVSSWASSPSPCGRGG